MGAIQRMGDSNNAGGSIDMIPQGTVYANNLLVAVNGSRGSGDSNSHPYHTWATTGGSSNVFVNSIPVNFTGNTDSCGDSRVGGSGNVFVDS